MLCGFLTGFGGFVTKLYHLFVFFRNLVMYKVVLLQSDGLVLLYEKAFCIPIRADHIDFLMQIYLPGLSPDEPP